MGVEPEVISLGVPYLRVMLLGGVDDVSIPHPHGNFPWCRGCDDADDGPNLFIDC